MMAEQEKYFDKNGNQIKAGMTIKHDDGDIDKVYTAIDGDLGLNASNKNHPNYIAGYNQELYPLYQFNLKEWEIVNESKQNS
jgi:hypothetical protein